MIKYQKKKKKKILEGELQGIEKKTSLHKKFWSTYYEVLSVTCLILQQ